MISVERILEFTNLESEEQIRNPRKHENKDEIPLAWPVHGKIEFNKLNFSYKENSRPVLKALDIKIKGGEKIGIIGMTGSGKTSIFMAMLRMAPLSGRNQICIDDVDISNIRLKTLRSRITNIPVRSIHDI